MLTRQLSFIINEGFSEQSYEYEEESEIGIENDFDIRDRGFYKPRYLHPKNSCILLSCMCTNSLNVLNTKDSSRSVNHVRRFLK